MRVRAQLGDTIIVGELFQPARVTDLAGHIPRAVIIGEPYIRLYGGAWEIQALESIDVGQRATAATAVRAHLLERQGNAFDHQLAWEIFEILALELQPATIPSTRSIWTRIKEHLHA